MKRLLGWLLLLIILGVGVYEFWPRHGGMPPQPPQPPKPEAAANFDARPLSSAEQAAFLPLVCAGAGSGEQGYAHGCQGLPGYPSQDYGGAGTGLGLTLTTVIYGHLTSDDADEAYVSYQGSFEPHANNFGGGILFHKTGNGWALSRWYPGGAMEHCLALNPQGRARFLCLFGFTGQGESDTSLFLVTIPAQGPLDLKPVLRASDLRETMVPNANCGQRQSPAQAVLLSIDSLGRNNGQITAEVNYVPADIATAACKANNFAGAATRKATLTLGWDGSQITITPDLHFAPVPQ